MLNRPHNIPPDLVAVSLIDAKTCAAAGGVSLSHWHDLVREGIAPTPVMRRQRCTRWRLSEIVQFWGHASQLSDPEPSMTHALRAARAARG